ncbi:MAG: serine/threonine-protein kinase [Actinomycetota bacterium]
MSLIGTYEVIGPVGTGSTSTVWKAHDAQLDRNVALKRLDNPTPALREQWRAEAQVLASLSEAHIVEVYGFIEDDTAAYIVEEWVDGATLSTVLAKHRQLSSKQALGVIRGALLGLAHAHQRGIVHRDVSTSNILVDLTGTSRLIDFGLAAPTGSVGSFGTSAYRSTEATSDQPATPASDVYSAAAVLTHLLTGLAATPPDPSRSDPALRAVLLRALQTNPLDRYRDAGEFLAALEDAAERRYGAAWWTEAGMAALAGSAGVAAVQAAAGASGGHPDTTSDEAATTAAAGLLSPVRGGITRRTKFVAAAAAAGLVALGSIAFAISSRDDGAGAGAKPAPSSTPALTGAPPLASVAASESIAPASIAPSATPTPALTPTPTATPTPTPTAKPVTPAQALAGMYNLTGKFTAVNVFVFNPDNVTPTKVGDPVPPSVWTVKAICTAATTCTAQVVSSSGRRYTLVLSGGHWRGQSETFATNCITGPNAGKPLSHIFIVVDLPDPSAKLASQPKTLTGQQIRHYDGGCGPGSGGTATATIVLTRR